jgi:hypothetical protein
VAARGKCAAGGEDTLGGGGPTGQRAWVDAFEQRLRELGWIEGRTVAIEYRWGEGRADRYAEIAAEFVRLSVVVSVVIALSPTRPAHVNTTSPGPMYTPCASVGAGVAAASALAVPSAMRDVLIPMSVACDEASYKAAVFEKHWRWVLL